MTDIASVNVAEILEKEEHKKQVEALQAAFGANEEAMKRLNAVNSVEDAYEIFKEFVTLKLEDFKVLFHKTVDYFKGDKVALQDEVLDSIAGGWSLSSWWNEYKQEIVAGVIIVGCAAVGLAIGACTGGLAGALIGGCVGVFVGFIAGIGTAKLMD